MKSDDYKMLGGLALAGLAAYILYKQNKAPVTSDQLTRTLVNNPLLNYASTPEYTSTGSLRQPVVTQSTLEPTSTLIMTLNNGYNTTYKLQEGDYEKLNVAQKILLNLPFIPQNWVLG